MQPAGVGNLVLGSERGRSKCSNFKLQLLITALSEALYLRTFMNGLFGTFEKINSSYGFYCLLLCYSE